MPRVSALFPQGPLGPQGPPGPAGLLGLPGAKGEKVTALCRPLKVLEGLAQQAHHTLAILFYRESRGNPD